MRRATHVLLAAIALSFSYAGDRAVAACGVNPCSLQWEYCEETAEYFYSEYRLCCTGFCIRPIELEECNNDSNQCYCKDIESSVTRRP